MDTAGQRPGLVGLPRCMYSNFKVRAVQQLAVFAKPRLMTSRRNWVQPSDVIIARLDHNLELDFKQFWSFGHFAIPIPTPNQFRLDSDP